MAHISIENIVDRNNKIYIHVIIYSEFENNIYFREVYHRDI